MWVVVDALLGCRNAGVLQQADGAAAGFGFGQRQVGADGLGELPADGVQRVQRGQRVLKDRANLAAPDVAHGVATELVDALAFEVDLATRNTARWLQQADDGRTGEGLARARFTYHAQNFAGSNVEGNVVECAQGAASVGEFNHQVFDLEKAHVGVFLLQRRRGFKASRSQSPSRFTLSAISTSMAPGKTVIHHSPEKM